MIRKLGKFFWNKRDVQWFQENANKNTPESNMKAWNARFAGKEITSLNGMGYLRASPFDESVRVHRLIWFYQTGEWPDQIDHINGVRYDNRWCNLRNVSAAENSKNRKRRNDNASGDTGVFWRKDRNKWRAQIQVAGNFKHLGYFDSLEDAVAARKMAEIKYEFHENHGRN